MPTTAVMHFPIFPKTAYCFHNVLSVKRDSHAACKCLYLCRDGNAVLLHVHDAFRHLHCDGVSGQLKMKRPGEFLHHRHQSVCRVIRLTFTRRDSVIIYPPPPPPPPTHRSEPRRHREQSMRCPCLVHSMYNVHVNKSLSEICSLYKAMVFLDSFYLSLYMFLKLEILISQILVNGQK